MKVLVVDDEKLARERLLRMVNDIDGMQVIGEGANGFDAVELAMKAQPDVVVMDIRMPGMDGLEAARHIAALDAPPAVVFCTAYDEHAIAAFNVQAVGYLLKPVRRAELEGALRNASRANRAQLAALAGHQEGRRTHISARTRRGIDLVPVADVRYFLAEHKYVTVRHSAGEVLIEDTLRDLEVEFGSRFLRIHRNALINGDHIDGVDRSNDGLFSVRMRGIEDKLQVSRRHVADLRRYVEEL